MASAQQLKEWATDCMKQSTVSVSQITANSYRNSLKSCTSFPLVEPQTIHKVRRAGKTQAPAQMNSRVRVRQWACRLWSSVSGHFGSGRSTLAWRTSPGPAPLWLAVPP